MILFSLTAVFCLTWRIRITDGSPARESHVISANRESKQHVYFLTSRNMKTAATQRVDSEVKFTTWNDNSELVSGKHKLISNRKNKQWGSLKVTVNTYTFLESELLNSIKGTKRIPYYRRRRNTHSLSSNASIVVPSVNFATSQLGTVPGHIQTNGPAHMNSGSVAVDAGGVDVSQTVDSHTNGDTAAGTSLSTVQGDSLNGQVHRHANGSIRESSSLESPSYDNTRNNHQGSAPSEIVPGSQPDDTPGVNIQSGALDRPSDIDHRDRAAPGPVAGAAPMNFTEGSEHSNTDNSSEVPTVDTNIHLVRNATSEELSHIYSTLSLENGSNNVNEPNNHLNSNTISSSGALSPAVINGNEKINQHPHPTNDQDNATEVEKLLSDQNSSTAVNATSSVESLAAASAVIIQSLRQLDLSLISTNSNLQSVTISESTPALGATLTLQRQAPGHAITSTGIHEDIFSSPTQMFPASHIFSTLTGDIIPSRHMQEGEVRPQTVIIQPTVVVLSAQSHESNALHSVSPSTSNALHSVSPSTSRSKSEEDIPNEVRINELLRSSLPSRITASTSSPSDITPVLTELKDNPLQSNPPHSHYVAASLTPTVALFSSRPLIIVVPHHATTLTVLPHPSGDPPPIVHGPDALSNLGQPFTEGNEMEEKTTEKVSTASEESSTNHHTGSIPSYTTTTKTTSLNNKTETPTSYMELKFRMSWPDFCENERTICQELVAILQVDVDTRGIAADQIQMMDRESVNCSQSDLAEIMVRIYLTNVTHNFDRNLTWKSFSILHDGLPSIGNKNSILHKLEAIQFYDNDSGRDGPAASTWDPSNGEHLTSDSPDHRVTLAIALAVVGGCCCIVLIVLQVVVRRRNNDTSSIPPITRSYTQRSSDFIQLASVVKSRPNSGLYNPGLDILEPLEYTHPMNYMQLSNFCMDETKIHEEYQKLPQRMPRPSMVPAGEEDKNRYANILPLVHTRVKLTQDGPGCSSTYINANYVTGPNNQCQYYIATQAPTEKTITDFWTMIWQQGCQTIVMLTDMEEQGQIKCASYWPELVGKSAAHKHGDFLIELIRKDVHQEYIVSRLEINHQRKIETRQIDHFWYTCWPPHGLPEPISLVKLVLDVRPKYENGSSPLLVHCSPGTGRTCTFIALDLCMKQFETRRIVDVMKTVNSIRQERAGAIQNKEQYALLYNAIHEYAAIVVTPGIPATSSAATLQALLSS